MADFRDYLTEAKSFYKGNSPIDGLKDAAGAIKPAIKKVGSALGDIGSGIKAAGQMGGEMIQNTLKRGNPLKPDPNQPIGQ